MNNKDEPIQCESKVCCKATASLEAQVKKELDTPDKALDELIAASGDSASAILNYESDNEDTNS